MNEELLKALGSAVGGGVVSGALLLILYKVGSRIIERLIAAIDRLATNQADTREVVVALDAKLDAVLDERERTPVEIPRPVMREPSDRDRRRDRIRTNPSGVRAPRPGTHHDE